MHTDILIGLLSRIVPLRATMAEQALVSGINAQHEQWLHSTHTITLTHSQKDGKKGVPPLKLITMSATLRVDGMTECSRCCCMTLILFIAMVVKPNCGVVVRPERVLLNNVFLVHHCRFCAQPQTIPTPHRACAEG
jgi:hypothetical protein